MSAPRRYALRSLAASTVAASLLVGGLATSAQAATTPSIAQAKATLPASKLVPGSVKIAGPVQATTKAISIPCLTKPKTYTLDGHTVGASYLGKEKSTLSPKYLQWGVTVIFFSSAAKANAAAATLNAAEKACPKTSTRTVKGANETWARSLGAKSTVGGFKGYRTVENLTVSQGTFNAYVRAYETYLVRGKVMLQLEEVAGATPTNGKLQDKWRKAMTTLMVKRLTALT
jgi:hypothetical protein